MHFEPRKGDIVEIIASERPVNRYSDDRLGIAMILEKKKPSPWVNAYWVRLLWSDDAKITMGYYRDDQFQIISEK